MKKDLKKIIAKQLEFLSKKQQKDGSFLNVVSTDKNFKKNFRENHAIFSSCLILSCLNTLESSLLGDRTRKKIVAFLLAQKSPSWTFNYWNRKKTEFKAVHYPDDLDDTFCALSALCGFSPKIITEEALVKSITVLTAMEKKAGGPYCTWIVAPGADKAWFDIDLAVNSNVAFFLSLEGIELENINRLVEESEKAGRVISPYYASTYSVHYFISRFYRGEKVENFRRNLFAKRGKNHAWNDNVLDTALAVSALLNFGCRTDEVIESIKYLLAKKALWQKSYPFVVEAIEKKQVNFSGSPALSVAFILEALNKYQKKLDESRKIGVENESKADDRVLQNHQSVIQKTEKLFSATSVEMKDRLRAWTKMLTGDGKGTQITLLAHQFEKTLQKKRKKISKEVLLDLGVANLLGWIAYSIYDNFLDGEGKKDELSLANMCLRKLSLIFAKVSPKSDFPELFRKTMDELEEANFWEVANCRAKIKKKDFHLPEKLPDFDDYSVLAQKSMGHALGPIAVLFLSGMQKNSFEMKKLILFFQRYIIAKQLNDDAHDWEVDLKNGQISPVVLRLIEKWRNKKASRKIISLEKDLRLLQNLFYHEVLLEVCADILKNVSLAKKAIAKVSYFEDKTFFFDLLAKEEASAKKAIAEQREAKSFLKVIQKIEKA